MIEWRDLRDEAVGARFIPSREGTLFRIWASRAREVTVRVTYARGETRDYPMKPGDRGYFQVEVSGARIGDRYGFLLDGKGPFADPASRFQPEGVHGLSEITATDFAWTDSAWRGTAREELVIYELHVGTFTPSSDFAGIQRHLSRLRELGVTAIELMPVGQFPGRRNWGYDGVFLFAPQNSYGGPGGLRALVNAAHREGLAVILDVVYNHLGPEGNVLGQFGDYFQSKYKTPWGDAVNYDGPGSDEVKRFVLQNAWEWIEDYHFDGLRLDAVHAISDASQHPVLEYFGDLKRLLERRTGRTLHFIAESDLNDPRLLRSKEEGGDELDLQWNDDFHHSLRTALTGETGGYYQDFAGLPDLAQVYAHRTLYRDRYSKHRRASHGRDFGSIDPNRFVVYSQNHDQIGNRALGDRLIEKVGDRKQLLAAACVFLSPFAPQIFMGEEYGERRPFQYFIDHEDPKLVQAVREGRRREFAGLTEGEAPDPYAVETFDACRIEHERYDRDARTRKFFAEYRELIVLSKRLRRERGFEEAAVIYRDDWKRIELVSDRYAAFFSFDEVEKKLPEEFASCEILFRSDPASTTTRIAPFSAVLMRRNHG